MNCQHRDLAAGRWQQLSFFEQMANIGSEVSRALNWQEKNNPAFSEKAAQRSLELVDLTLAIAGQFSRYKELARLREAIVDYFFCSNQFLSTPDLWRKYFLAFNYVCRKSY